jgi:beta-1,4-mannosyl-glycoprotein beta-1,4-N-acetylglucosaminyltransferase
MLSVIIPTLKKSKPEIFWNLIKTLNSCSVVGEIIVLNNSNIGFDNDSFEKVTFYNTNTSVNKSWNIGVQKSKYEHVLLLNDDISVSNNVIIDTDILLKDETIGVVTAHTTPTIHESNEIYINTIQSFEFLNGWFIGIRKNEWVDIPEYIDTFFGDIFIHDQIINKKLDAVMIINNTITHDCSSTVNKIFTAEEKMNILIKEKKKYFNHMYGKIHDVFLYNGENDILNLRLLQLYDFVDYFHIVEFDTTFTGKEKKINSLLIQPKYKDKIKYHILHQSEIYDNPWDNEEYQRNQLKTTVSNCNDNDVIILSDVDEIPDVRTLNTKMYNSPYVCIQELRQYYLNWKSEQQWMGSVIALWKDVKNINFEEVRKKRATYNQLYSGWHTTYIGLQTKEDIKNKLSDISHQELNNDKSICNIINNKQQMKGIYGDSLSLSTPNFRFIDIVYDDFYKFIFKQNVHVVIPTMLQCDIEMFKNNIIKLLQCNIIKEICIIDNSNTTTFNEIITSINEQYDTNKIRIISNDNNIGVNPAWNEGMKYNNSEFYLLLNDDIDFDIQILYDSINIMNKHDKVDVVAIPEKNIITKSEDIQYNIYKPDEFTFTEKDGKSYKFTWGWFIFGRSYQWKDIPYDLIYFFGDNVIYDYIEKRHNFYAIIKNRFVNHQVSKTISTFNNKNELYDIDRKQYDKIII